MFRYQVQSTIIFVAMQATHKSKVQSTAILKSDNTLPNDIPVRCTFAYTCN